MKTYIKDMTEGNPTKLLLSFALPMVLGNLFQQLYNLVDSMIVGKFVGADALAAVGATGSLNFLFFSVCLGMANGIGINISQCFGAGNHEDVKKSIANAAYIMVVTSLVMGTLGCVLARPILTLLHTPENILDMSVLYMQISCMGVLAVGIYNCVSSILRAVGDAKTPLYFLIVASILNIGLDLLFVKGFAWSVAGAAVATIIAQAVSGIGCLLFSFAKNPYFKLERAHLRVEWQIIWKCVRMGIPLAFQSSLIAISCVALQSVVNTFGSTVVAAFTATSRIEQLVQQPYNSLGMAMSTYSGQNIGAGKVDRVKLGYRKGCMIMIAFSLLMLPVIQFAGEPIMKLFVDEAEVITLGASALKITSWFYVFLGAIYVTRGLLNGVGDAAFAFLNGVVEMIGRICFAKPLTLIPIVGVWGVWWATGLTWMLAGVVSVFRYKQGKWIVKSKKKQNHSYEMKRAL